MGIAPDAIVQRVKSDHVGHLASVQQALKFFHGCCVVPSIVKCKVADLNWG